MNYIGVVLHFKRHMQAVYYELTYIHLNLSPTKPHKAMGPIKWLSQFLSTHWLHSNSWWGLLSCLYFVNVCAVSTNNMGGWYWTLAKQWHICPGGPWYLSILSMWGWWEFIQFHWFETNDYWSPRAWQVSRLSAQTYLHIHFYWLARV